jgi:hypothetical protein
MLAIVFQFVPFLRRKFLVVGEAMVQKMGGMAPQAQVWHELQKRKKEGEKEKKKRKEGGTKLPTCSNATKKINNSNGIIKMIYGEAFWCCCYAKQRHWCSGVVIASLCCFVIFPKSELEPHTSIDHIHNTFSTPVYLGVSQ